MPSLSPGSESPSPFAQILPGAPAESLQSLTTFTFRWKRYIVYISGRQLNILRSPTELVQAVSFDKELVAVCAEGDQGAKIAVASAGNVWVLEPQTDNWNQVTWRKVLSLKREDAGDVARSLSWGNDGELLVGGTNLASLFSVLPSSRNGTPVASPRGKEEKVEERHVLWSKSVPSPLQQAVFSPSANLIASFGPRDRLVKIWRRLSFEEGLFDYAYLPHPSAVTHIEWRRPDAPQLEEEAEESDEARARSYGARNDEDQELLYTICADGILRVWRTGGQHDLDVMVLQTLIDLVGAIPNSPSLSSKKTAASAPARYAFILPSGALAGAIGAAVSKQHIGKITHSVEHLKEVSSKQPDAVVTLDGNGRMSAWGLQTIGHKRRPSTPSGGSKQPYHIAHAEDLDLNITAGTNVRFQTWFDGDQLNVLFHAFDGAIEWWQGSVESFLSPAMQGSDRLVRVGRWYGSKCDIVGLRSPDTTGTLLAWSSDGGLSQFTSRSAAQLEIDAYCSPQSGSRNPSIILDACFLGDETGTLCVDDSSVFVVVASGKILATTHHSLKGPLRLHTTSAEPSAHRGFLLLGRTGSYSTVLLNNLSDTSKLQVTVGLPRDLPIKDHTSKPVPQWTDVQLATHPRKQSWLRLIGIDTEGTVSRRDVPIEALQNEIPELSESCLSLPSGFDDPSLLAATSDVATIASADGRNVIMMDLKDGYVEHRHHSPQPVLSARLNVCNHSPSDHIGDANNTLALAYRERVDIFAQARYEPANSAEHNTWHHLKTISISGIGLTIRSIAWLSAGELVVAAGNSLLRSDGLVAGTEIVPELRDRLDMSTSATVQSHSLMHALRKPLVSWHPHFLQQLGLRGQLHAAIGVLKRLERTLRFYTEGDELHPLLNANPTEVIAASTHQDTSPLDSDTINSLKQQLEDIDLPKTSDAEQERLKIVLGTIIFMQEHKGSLDENGFRYLFSWKLHVLELESQRNQASPQDEKLISNGDEPLAPAVPAMSWREIVFAYHSETQQPLLEALQNYYSGKMDWPTVRKLGIPAWLHAVRAAQSEGSDLASLEQIFDSLAQTSFRAVYPPDPTRASLFFLAMRKKATLLALWRVAVGNKEQRTTSNFLKRDFTLEENRTAARKNAYALMGKRRFEYAAAFFLLANDPASAIRVLAGQCQDLPLAIAVARVYCDDGSPDLLKFMEERVLPEARQAGDRWLLSWVHEMMGHTHLAAQALVLPINSLESAETERTPRHWQQDDPLTLRLYQHLRDKPTKPGQKQKSLGGEQHEYRAVLRAARILRKMGLWLLALELVSTWRFKYVVSAPPESDGHTTNGESVPAISTNGTHDQPAFAPSMLDDFFSPPSTTEAPKSMLDDFDAPKAPAPKAPKSMLDGFDNLSLESPADKAKSDREAKAAELMAKLKAKKEEAGKPPVQEAKKAPTQFKEPEASSILDSFGF